VKLFGRGGQKSKRRGWLASALTGWSDEIDPLVTLVYLRLLEPDANIGNVREEEKAEVIASRVATEQRTFVECRVRDRLRWYARTVNTINFVRDFMSGIIAGGGIIIAGVSASHPSASHGLTWQNWVAIALGVVVGVLGAIAPRVARGEQVERYRRGMNRLRLEAWRFATKRGQYARLKNIQTAFDRFVDKVEEIENEALATEVDISQEK
jgi:hypothetical protein